MTEERIVDVGALADPARAPKVRLAGRVMAVGQLTGATAHRLAVAQKSGDDAASLGALMGAVRSALPDLTDAEADALTIEQITAIVRLSRGQLEAVEAEIAERAAGN